jgi:hypothetical protein
MRFKAIIVILYLSRNILYIIIPIALRTKISTHAMIMSIINLILLLYRLQLTLALEMLSILLYTYFRIHK